MILGEVRMCGQVWGSGDVIVLDPGEATAFEEITDVVTVAVKVPSLQGDKHLGTFV